MNHHRFQPQQFNAIDESHNINTGVPFALLQMAKDLQLGTTRQAENFVFSLCSIQLALCLVATGAKGSTLKELLNFLESESLNHLNSVATQLLATLTRPEISFVGGIWVDQSLPLKPKFKSDAQTIFKVAKIETIDFQNETKAKEAFDEVNEWAEVATKGLISSLLPEDSKTRVLLANALYFKGMWSEKFDIYDTKNSKFYLHDGNVVEVPFMISSKKQCIETYNDFKVLKLSYEDSTVSMYVVLPHKIDGLKALVGSSNPRFLDQYVHKDMEAVTVGKFMLPKFKITYKFEASEALQRTGLKSAFSDEAEFDEMVEGLKLDEGLKIDKVHHKSCIEVDEEGTEAAAATIVQMVCFGLYSLPELPVDFVADHAFMFIVRDDQSGMVLFMGHVVNPLLE